MTSSELPENDAAPEEGLETSDQDKAVKELPEAVSEPPKSQEDDFEDEVEVFYVGAPTRFYDPASIDDPEHDAPRPSTIPRRERRAASYMQGRPGAPWAVRSRGHLPWHPRHTGQRRLRACAPCAP